MVFFSIGVPSIIKCPKGMQRVASSCVMISDTVEFLDTPDSVNTIHQDQMDLNNLYEY